MIDNAANIKAVEAFNINQNTWLILGHSDMHQLENVILGNEMLNSPAFRFLSLDRSNDKTGKPYASIIQTAETYKIDYVLLYLGQGPVLNRCLIFSSDFYIILSDVNLPGLNHINYAYDDFKKWSDEMKIYSQNMQSSICAINFPVPKIRPKFLGLLLNVSGRLNDSTSLDELLVLISNQNESLMTISTEEFLIKQIKKGINKLVLLNFTEF